MTQNNSNATSPRRSTTRRGHARRLIVSVLAVAVLAAAGLYFAGAFQSFLDPSKPARQQVRRYLTDISSGDISAASTIAYPTVTADEIKDQARRLQPLGALRDVSFATESYYGSEARNAWFFRGTAHFARNAIDYDARLLEQEKGNWAVQDVHFASLDDSGSGSSAAQPAGDSAGAKNARHYDAPPKMSIDPAKTYVAKLETTRGPIMLDLYPREAPITVNNFVFLAHEGFYDGLSFHRVIADFMIQGGDPTGTGKGGPGYNFEDETDPDKNPHKFQAGTLAMANSGPNTNGSQFFITHVPTPWLQGHHTIFGQVVDAKSQDVVNAIRQGDVIKSIKIEEKGGEPKKDESKSTQPATQHS